MTANHRPLEEGDIALIDRVHATPCLYDTKDPNFRLIYKKDQEWQSIAEGLAMSDWEARKRWTVLRDRYSRELKQLMLHPDSTEYGRNEFFLRMDFLRDFVKKRKVKRKRCDSEDDEIRIEKKPRPLKLYKVKCEQSNFESDYNEVSQQEKSYITDDSQYSSNEKYSFVEQIPQDPIAEGDRQCVEQEYHDYVEDTSVPFESVDEDHESVTRVDPENYMSVNNGRRIIMKPESSKVAKRFFGNKISTLPQLQQRPITTNLCTAVAPPSQPVDMEEYFSKTIALYLRHLSPRYKIKAKVEIMQIIEKYVDLQESKS